MDEQNSPSSLTISLDFNAILMAQKNVILTAVNTLH